MDQVKFVALDRDDLEVVFNPSAGRPGQGGRRHLASAGKAPGRGPEPLRLARGGGETRPELRRCRSALRFERVNCCKCRQVNPAGKDAVLNLLAVEFAETDAPAGVVTLIFSGGGVLRLEVECLEAELADLGPSWPAAERPVHRDATDARG